MRHLSVIIKNDSSITLLADWAKRLNIEPALETSFSFWLFEPFAIAAATNAGLLMALHEYIPMHWFHGSSERSISSPISGTSFTTFLVSTFGASSSATSSSASSPVGLAPASAIWERLSPKLKKLLLTDVLADCPLAAKDDPRADRVESPDVNIAPTAFLVSKRDSLASRASRASAPERPSSSSKSSFCEGCSGSPRLIHSRILRATLVTASDR
mmetsp:Transcript_23401/g.38211  ORF Transcript_23401/g.38211 Transcript_23401/m.38211 type:complete len:214 (-) Transcript_23401:739-1380(-)